MTSYIQRSHYTHFWPWNISHDQSKAKIQNQISPKSGCVGNSVFSLQPPATFSFLLKLMPWLAGPRLRGKGIKRGTKQDDIKWYYYRRGISAPLWHHKDLVFQECWVLTNHSRLFYLCIGIRRILNTIWDLQVKGRYTDRHKQGISLEMTSITQLKSAGHRETSHNYLSVQPHRSPILLSRFISLDTTRQTSDRKWKSAWSWCRGRHHLPGTPFDRLAALRVRASITGVKIDCPLFLQKHIDCCTNTTGRGESNVIGLSCCRFWSNAVKKEGRSSESFVFCQHSYIPIFVNIRDTLPPRILKGISHAGFGFSIRSVSGCTKLVSCD